MPTVRSALAAVPEPYLEIIRERAPDAADVRSLDDDLDLAAVDFLVPIPASDRFLDELRGLERLAVVQTLSAGIDKLDGLVPPQATLCSARGARDAPVAEWIAGALLGASTTLLEFARRREWERGRRLADLGAWTVLVIGMGSIGEAVRSRLEPFGTTVIGVASRARGDVRGIDELDALLPGASAIVLLTPLTEATRGLIGAAQLAALPDGAVVVNAARGQVLDAEALLAEVSSGRLRAVLDVTDPEPLPDDHPLWSAPGVLAVTPHLAGNSELGGRRAAELAGDQLARFCTGEPLLNVVRKGKA